MLGFQNFDRVRFWAIVKANRATDTAIALVLGGFDATPVQMVGDNQTLLRTGLYATFATFALVRIDLRTWKLNLASRGNFFAHTSYSVKKEAFILHPIQEKNKQEVDARRVKHVGW